MSCGSGAPPPTTATPSTDLILLGAGGNVNDVLDIIDAHGTSINVLGVLDDRRPRASLHLGLEVLGPLADCSKFPSARFISTIHNERAHREHAQILARLGLPADRFATLIHPRAVVSRRAEIAPGVYICDGASVAGGVSVGAHTSIGPHAIAGHDTLIEPHCVIAAGALLGGGVHLGEACYVGSAAAIRPGVAVGRGALIGLGAVVVRDVAAGWVVVGNPARPLDVSRMQRVR